MYVCVRARACVGGGGDIDMKTGTCGTLGNYNLRCCKEPWAPGEGSDCDKGRGDSGGDSTSELKFPGGEGQESTALRGPGCAKAQRPSQHGHIWEQLCVLSRQRAEEVPKETREEVTRAEKSPPISLFPICIPSTHATKFRWCK